MPGINDDYIGYITAYILTLLFLENYNYYEAFINADLVLWFSLPLVAVIIFIAVLKVHRSFFKFGWLKNG